MSDAQLTEQPTPSQTPGRPAWVRVAVEAAAILVLFAVVGAVAGVVWEWLWTPPSGVVFHHRWYPDETWVRGLFSGTGWYVLVAVVAGLVAGVVSALAFHRRELVSLVAVVAGSLLAGFVMWHLGTALGPADPRHAAATMADYKPLIGKLTTSGGSYRIAFPVGALLGLGAVFLGRTGRHIPRG